jgi:hypothetical protein
LNSLDNHISNLKEKLEEDFFSPSFLRLANIFYLNNKFDECISICKIGLQLIPDYITPRILLIKALLKLEYITEAEAELQKIENKILKTDIYQIFINKISTLKKTSSQERIYYPGSLYKSLDYKIFEKRIKRIVKEIPFPEHNETEALSLDKLNDSSSNEELDMNSFDAFLDKLSALKLEKDSEAKTETESETETQETSDYDIMSKMKIITETLADIYAKQGNFKEAFSSYNFLIRAGSPNKKRIEEKLIALERNLIKDSEFQ